MLVHLPQNSLALVYDGLPNHAELPRQAPPQRFRPRHQLTLTQQKHLPRLSHGGQCLVHLGHPCARFH